MDFLADNLYNKSYMKKEGVCMAVVLLTGGVRSGKSAMAQRLLEDGGEVLYIATARCLDGEMERRIALHRASPPPGSTGCWRRIPAVPCCWTAFPIW